MLPWAYDLEDVPEQVGGIDGSVGEAVDIADVLRSWETDRTVGAIFAKDGRYCA